MRIRWAMMAATLGLLAVDSKGHLYTAEVETAQRAQKFVNQGLSPVEP